jgi:MYXO-CTERM domain-containing protein
MRTVSRNIASRVVFGVAAVGMTAAVQAAPLLQVDVSDRTAQDGSTTDSGKQADYALYLLGASYVGTDTNGSTQAVLGTSGSSYSLKLAPVTVYPVGGGPGTLDDRDRNFPYPEGSTTTLTEVYDDFAFNNSNSGGIQITIGGGELQANTQYSVSIYAYDHSSGNVRRTANYVDVNNANALVLTTSFLGSPNPGPTPAAERPTTNEANKFTGVAITDANGFLRLNGINTTAISTANGLPTAAGVFINGIEVSPVPEPTAAAAAAAVIGLAGLARRRRRGR